MTVGSAILLGIVFAVVARAILDFTLDYRASHPRPVKWPENYYDICDCSSGRRG